MIKRACSTCKFILILLCAQPSRTVFHFLDTFVTVAVVWTLGPLFWITLGYVFDRTIFPDDYELSMATSCVAGYLAVAVFWAFQEPVKRMSQGYEKDNM